MDGKWNYFEINNVKLKMKRNLLMKIVRVILF